MIAAQRCVATSASPSKKCLACDGSRQSTGGSSRTSLIPDHLSIPRRSATFFRPLPSLVARKPNPWNQGQHRV